MRTASKAYALAGLRVGFAIADPAVIERLNPYRPPGSVSTVSVTVVADALADDTVLDANLERVRVERERLTAGLTAAGWAVGPSVTNFLLVDLGSPERAAAATEGLLRRGLVPRTFPAGHPLAGFLRLTVRAAPENDRIIQAATEIARETQRMTTPLGELTIGPREGRRVTVARTTNETEITVTLGLDGSGHAAIDTGIGFYDHLLGSFAHHGLFDLAIHADGDLQVDEHHTVEDVALVLGSAVAEALGDRAGIRRFGDSAVPMDESVATAVIDIGGRPYAVIDLPFRGERVGGLPLQLVEHALESFARTAGRDAPPARHRPQRPPPRRGRVQGARSRAARGGRAGPAADRRGVHEGLARVSATPRIAVVDYGAGNLVSIDQAFTSVGAAVTVVRDGEMLRDVDALVVPGVGAAAPAMARLEQARPDRADRRAGWRPGGRSSASAWACSSCSRRATRTARSRSGALAGRTVRLEDAPTLPHIGWNQVERTRDHPLFDGIADGADFYFVHSYAGDPVDADESAVLARTTHGRPFVSAIARGPVQGVQFHPERSGPDGLRLLANFVAMARAA